MRNAISLVAFEERQGRFIFVAVPNQNGRYVRTDRSIALVDCPMCGSIAGEPCSFSRSADGQKKYGSGSHHVRRLQARCAFGRGCIGDDVIGNWVPDPVPDEYMEASA